MKGAGRGNDAYQSFYLRDLIVFEINRDWLVDGCKYRWEM